MTRQDLVEHLVTEIHRVLSSYPISGKIVVMNVGKYGVSLAMAQACIMARVSKVIVLGPDASFLEKMMDTLMPEKAVESPQEDEQQAQPLEPDVHSFIARGMDPDAVASVFLAIHETIGIPDVLILQNASRIHDNHILEHTASKLITGYTTNEVQECLYFNEKSKIALVRGFLAPGTRKRKSLINVAMVESHIPGDAENTMHFLAHAKKLYRDWKFTIHKLSLDIVSAELLKGATNGTGWVWDDRKVHSHLCFFTDR